MNFILSDGNHREDLFPFTLTRPVAEMRIGILTIREKWEKWLGEPLSFQTEDYLSEKFPLHTGDENVVINGSYLPNESLVQAIQQLQLGEALMDGGEYIAYATKTLDGAFDVAQYQVVDHVFEGITVKNTWDIFSKNGEAIQADFDLVTAGRKSQPISKTNQVLAPENIFLEEGATVEFCTLNASTGPIYIGKNALMMEGSMVRGGFVLGESAIVKMGAKIYGPTTAGPGSKLGGEVNNSVLFANSNKGHDGFLGNSVLGEWCNIGADTNTSNLKNNYAEVRLWNYRTENFARTGLQFCGLMMGDHSKCGINVMFNTGTVVGVSANIFGGGFPRNFVPSYSWGGAAGFSTFLPSKAFEVATAMMKRRNMEFNDTEARILEHVFEFTKKWRNF
ncbi:UDP-N-acetylglucosamine diphosphorylase/glucosamine-1-phosphate N-acetyltransferase [Flagellimonas taeanensis]|uniref:UDP-N-acetylglucosamine diphosphorylase/glucosamine-1-phosphate N-acetyltransferase n=1 Tax=Flagellimonas taeanensis TaxID=1005926 RepID=A0A1M7AD90_9FLAO|nr:GlmU family protein [Allomuricauda taeanensis]SFC32820.1 UDP-N-acetylglucosamine diphosphorylase/glucosamine-1-phosphate N-acetyltransferase [Allomuricauda taeanensis]SHL40664.1 UDP-N-acetylglucosamine diphosphorylase/glucosamine-1-phosphate N-acetyltransferase [Allomuricauda taeanensis]